MPKHTSTRSELLEKLTQLEKKIGSLEQKMDSYSNAFRPPKMNAYPPSHEPFYPYSAHGEAEKQPLQPVDIKPDDDHKLGWLNKLPLASILKLMNDPNVQQMLKRFGEKKAGTRTKGRKRKRARSRTLRR